jgi:hypothetical protein
MGWNLFNGRIDCSEDMHPAAYMIMPNIKTGTLLFLRIKGSGWQSGVFLWKIARIYTKDRLN